MQNESFILRRCTDRYLWEKKTKENLKNKDKVDEEERTQMAQIDWYDFVVVDIIDFSEEELNNTVPITNMNQNANINVSSYTGNISMLLSSASRSIAGQNAIVSGVYGIRKDDKEIADENDIINNSKRLLGLAAFEKENRENNAGSVSANILNVREEEPKVLVNEAVNAEKATDISANKKEKEVVATQLPEPGMKIVTNYKRKLESGTAKKVDVQRCPLCHENIPIDELSRHMKIELLDPKWKEINKEIQERKLEVNIAPTSDFIGYLGEFAKDRPDLFGEDVGDILKLDEIKKLETKINMGNIRFDGFAPNMSRTTANIAMLAQQTKKNYEESTKAKEGQSILQQPSAVGFYNAVAVEKTNVSIFVKQQEPVINVNQQKSSDSGQNVVSGGSVVAKKDTLPSQMGKRMVENLVAEDVWTSKNPVRRFLIVYFFVSFVCLIIFIKIG